MAATLGELSPLAARLHGSRTFLELWSQRGPERHRSLSFSEFDGRVQVACGRLREQGVVAGTRVALLAHASPDSLALGLAVPTLGAVLVQLNWRQPEPVLLAMLRGLGCTLVVAGRGLSKLARRLCSQPSDARALWLIDADDGPAASADDGAATEAAAADASPLEVRSLGCAPSASSPGSATDEEAPPPTGDGPSADDVAVVMFTSGSSAMPKPVPLTHRGLLSACASKERAEREVLGVDFSSHRGTLAFLPPFHVIGFTNNFLYNLRAGVRCMVHLDAHKTPTSPALLLRACAELRPTLLDTVPALLEGMLPLDDEASRPLAECTAVLYGGAGMSRDAAAAFSSRGVRLYSQYGQTELAGMALIGSAGAPHGCMRPVGDIRCRLAVEAAAGGAADAPPSQGAAAAEEAVCSSGELMLSCVASLTPGYWSLDGQGSAGAPAVSAAASDEWATGDIFEEVGGGWLRHVCRRDDLVLHSSGEMSNPLAVEGVLLPSINAMLPLSTPAATATLFGSGRPYPALVVELHEGSPLPPRGSGGEGEGEGEGGGEGGGEREREGAAPLYVPGALPGAMPGAADGDGGPASGSPEWHDLCGAIASGLAAASAEVAAYSRPPAALVLLLHPSAHAMLPRTAKGGIVRPQVEKRFGAWLDGAYSRSGWARNSPSLYAAMGSLPDDDDADGAMDSFGLAALTGHGGRRRRLSEADAAADALLQHLKVMLLFAVILRHLQRFTVRTCHSWAKLAPNHTAVCLANNLLQTGAVEGLAFLSGVALAGRRVSWKEVAAPFVLILLFRQVLHPLLEWGSAHTFDIGTAHLWFVLMVGLGRLFCLPLSRLPPAASRLRLSVALLLLGWRLFLAPVHIGMKDHVSLRHALYFALFGDRNYLQIVHNLPLFVLGYVHRDLRDGVRHLAARLPAACSPLASAARALLSSPFSSPADDFAPRAKAADAADRRAPSPLSRLRAYLRPATLLLLTFVADPLLFGLFAKKIKVLEAHALLVYLRAALRVAALAAILPRRTTPLTSAGRSQLLAYLLHDGCFSILSTSAIPLVAIASSLGSPGLSAALPSLFRPEGGLADGLPPLLTITIALAELVLYCATCLAVQLALSHPALLPELLRRTAAGASRAAAACRGAGGDGRARLAALQLAALVRSKLGRGAHHKREPEKAEDQRESV